MYSFRLLALVLALGISASVSSAVVEKGSATDKAVASAIDKASAVTDKVADVMPTKEMVDGAVGQAKEALANVVTESIAVMKKGGAFVMEETPKVIREFMMWRLFQCIFWIGLFGFLIVVVLVGAYNINKHSLEEKERQGKAYDVDEDGWRLMAIVMRYVVSPIMFCLFIGPNIYEIIYIYVAPRIYLIENLAYLIKWGKIVP